MIQQRRLPHPRLTTDHYHGTLATLYRLHQPAQQLSFPATPPQYPVPPRRGFVRCHSRPASVRSSGPDFKVHRLEPDKRAGRNRRKHPARGDLGNRSPPASTGGLTKALAMSHPPGRRGRRARTGICYGKWCKNAHYPYAHGNEAAFVFADFYYLVLEAQGPGGEVRHPSTRTLGYADRTRVFPPAPAKTDETSDCYWAVVGVEGEHDRYI